MRGPLMEATELRERLGEPGLVVVDCRWRLGAPGAGRRGYAAGHVPGAAFLDVDGDLAAPPGPGGRHPLPAPAAFERCASAAGIHAGSSVVAYDDAELGGAARLWWLLRYFGHDAAAVLNGGLAAWLAAGGALAASAGGGGGAGGTDGARVARSVAGPGDTRMLRTRRGENYEGTARRVEGSGDPRMLRARPRAAAIATADEVLARAGEARLALLDARSVERYRGEVEQVDPVAGHIPGARNLPYAVIAPGGRYLPPAELRAALEAAGASAGRELVAYCGSGVSACTLLVAAEAAGLSGGRLYPGSWSEWAGRGLPAARG